MWIAVKYLLSVMAIAIPSVSTAQDASSRDLASVGEQLPQMTLHPLFLEPYVCSEHFYSPNISLGDALGQNCLIIAGVDFSTGSGSMKYFEGDGSRNTDWFSWNKPVAAPLSGLVSEIHVNDVVNVPGTMNPSLATSVTIVDDSGKTVVVAHLHSVSVSKGDRVAAGEMIGTVGNNGNSRNPHTHMLVPLRLRVNLPKFAGT